MKIPLGHQQKWARRLVWAVVAILGFWALGWLAVPPLLRSQAQKIATQKLGRQLSIGRVEFVPWTLELSVHDLAVAGADGAAPQVRIKRIYIDAELQSLLRLAPIVDALEVDEPHIRIAQLAPGRYDVDDVLARLHQSADPQSAPLGFALYNIAVRGGSVDFEDATVGRTHTVRSLDLQLPFLSNLKSQREVKVLPKLAFTLNGSAFNSAAEATPFTESQKADATVRLAGFDLAPYLGYWPASLPVRLQSGVLDADLRLAFEHSPHPMVKLSGKVQARNVVLADAAQQALLSFDALTVDVGDLQPLARSARITAIQLEAPRLMVRRDRTGQLNLPGAGAAPPPVQGNLAVDSAGAAPAPQGAAPAAGAGSWQLAVAQVAVSGGQVDWRDDSLPASAHVALQQLSLKASAIALPLVRPLRFSGSTQVVAPGAQATAAHLAFEGEASDSQAKVAASLRAFSLQWAAPYLGPFMEPQLNGLVDADVGLAWNAPALVAQVARLTVDGAELACAPALPCTSRPPAALAMRGKNTLAELKRLQIDDAQVDVLRRTVTVGNVVLTQPRAWVERAADGRWMFERWLRTRPAAAVPPQGAGGAAVAGAPWALQLNDFSLDAGSVAFSDAVPSAPVSFLVSSLRLRLKDFAPLAVGAKPSALHVSARVGAGRVDPGRLEYEGSLGLAPLAARGQVSASQLPLHALEPYFSDALNATVRRADGSFKGQVHYVQAPAGVQLRVQGDAALDDVRIRERVAGAAEGAAARPLVRGEELLNWKSLGLRGVDVRLEPGKPLAVDVRETALSDFFARVIVQENGRLNLQDLVKAPAPAAAGATAAVPAPEARNPAPLIRVGPVALAGGTVHFSDHFIQPNYSTDLSELNGQLSAFSSAPASGGEPNMADLVLRGRAEGTASLEVVGKLNPLAQPLALDIKGQMRDLELPALSPYTIKYAGHGIERGKLSMDVAYQVLPNGQLTASNKLVLKQLVFGDPVEGAPASLPVRLAVALLADRNGVIDVDLPISGSLNDPAFRLGPVIFKAIGNLIMKAVTAPFSLLAGALGGGDEMGSVAFAPGSAALDASARQSLDKVARALTDRPTLQMTVVGQANAEAERSAWKRERLQQMVLAQKRRAAARAGQSVQGIQSVEAAEYASLLQELYNRADITKPRNLVGMAKTLPQSEMESLLLASIPVPDGAMRELALARGVAVRDYLAAQQLPPERLFLGAPKTAPSTPEWKPHAELTLATR